MENASRALLMAGGILIALMIAAVVVLMFSRMSGYWAGEESIARTKNAAEFNNQYEPYLKDGLTLLELKSVYNKIVSNNEQNPPEYNIYTNIDSTGLDKIFPIDLDPTNHLDLAEFTQITDNFSGLQYDNFKKKSRLTFNCLTDQIEHNGPEGRISQINFEKIIH